MDATLTEITMLALTSLFAGMLNAVAGGGTFFAFPALLFAGAPPVAANATCTVALWPGVLSSIVAYRGYWKQGMQGLGVIICIAALGGWAGAELLLITSDQAFSVMVPWLLLVATLLFAYGKACSKWLNTRLAQVAWADRFRSIFAMVFLLITALYGGFFGAGIGILTLALLYVMGLDDMHHMNAVKTIIAAGINSAAFVTFLFSDIVLWSVAPVMIVASIIGGYVGANWSLKIPQQRVRRGVLCVAIAITVYFFVKEYGALVIGG